MIRAVLFDLDGTLFDRATSVRRCIEEQHRRQIELLSNVSRSDYVARFLELDAYGYTPKDIVYIQLATEYSLPDRAADLLCADFYANYHSHAVGFAEFNAAVGELRAAGLMLGIVTNGGETHQCATIRALNLESVVDTVLISETEGVRKPEAEIFRRAMDNLGVAPHEAVYVGDHPRVDIEGARSAGLRTMWRRNSNWGDCQSADWVIESLTEVLPLISADVETKSA